jgi:hypothetical protein
VSPVRYELGFISEKTAFFIVTAVKTSSLTSGKEVLFLFPALYFKLGSSYLTEINRFVHKHPG